MISELNAYTSLNKSDSFSHTHIVIPCNLMFIFLFFRDLCSQVCSYFIKMYSLISNWFFHNSVFLGRRLVTIQRKQETCRCLCENASYLQTLWKMQAKVCWTDFSSVHNNSIYLLFFEIRFWYFCHSGFYSYPQSFKYHLATYEGPIACALVLTIISLTRSIILYSSCFPFFFSIFSSHFYILHFGFLVLLIFLFYFGSLYEYKAKLACAVKHTN